MGCFHSMTMKTIYFNDGSFFGNYRIVLEGKLLTQGTYRFKNGFKYTGNFFNNKYSGEGKLENDCFIAKGNWKNNKLNGNCYLKISDKIIYKGDFKEGIPNGIISISINNYSYFGEIYNNKLEGFGVLKFKGETLYVGKWKNNKPYHQGKYYEDNNVFKVKIHEDQMIMDDGEEIKISLVIGFFKLIPFPIEFPEPDINK